jgi:hypothetical protein
MMESILRIFTISSAMMTVVAFSDNSSKTLTGAKQISAHNSRDIFVQLLVDDVNSIKQQLDLATSETNTYLSLGDLSALGKCPAFLFYFSFAALILRIIPKGVQHCVSVCCTKFS